MGMTSGATDARLLTSAGNSATLLGTPCGGALLPSTMQRSPTGLSLGWLPPDMAWVVNSAHVGDAHEEPPQFSSFSSCTSRSASNRAASCKGSAYAAAHLWPASEPAKSTCLRLTLGVAPGVTVAICPLRSLRLPPQGRRFGVEGSEPRARSPRTAAGGRGAFSADSGCSPCDEAGFARGVDSQSAASLQSATSTLAVERCGLGDCRRRALAAGGVAAMISVLDIMQL
mmetsp:Transcript_40505/g.101757  ORF Transcript_40505/g.101757 Transcript_40505/m.101757 type:complete len:228 (+) Transcript_40505:586-1269(+)